MQSAHGPASLPPLFGSFGLCVLAHVSPSRRTRLRLERFGRPFYATLERLAVEAPRSCVTGPPDTPCSAASFFLDGRALPTGLALRRCSVRVTTAALVGTSLRSKLTS